jgi:D-alanyl-lipoteichoic acid acyltransferase DltB (MBOAT superfamily)
MDFNDVIDYLQNAFHYVEGKEPMFTRYSFWTFFLVAYTLYVVVYKKIALRNTYLFLISLFFYYKISGLFFILLIFSTIVDYFIGIRIHNSTKERRRLAWLVLSIAVNLLVLSYFKYAYFFTESYNQMFSTNIQVINRLAQLSNYFFDTSYDIYKIFLPVGISYFTFQTISYSVDVYRRRIEPVRNILDFGFYVSFFPQLVAGPIVRANEFVPQLYKPFNISSREYGLALFMILAGLTKKLVFGDYIAVNFIDRIYANPVMYTGFENLMALFAYSLQVYCDFSGYTDIAIGLALLFGFYLPTNFNSPYKAQSTAEFWSRWHISLSTWLKDYLYIPLGGNRNSTWGTWISLTAILLVTVFLSHNLNLLYIFATAGVFVAIIFKIFPQVKVFIVRDINLMITMILGGLWHGASWNFVLWGGINGLGVVWYKYWSKISPFKNSSHWLVRTYAILITFTFISLVRIFFRAQDLETVRLMTDQILNHFNASLIFKILHAYRWVMTMFVVGMLLHWLPQKWKDYFKNKFIESHDVAKIALSVFVVFVIFQFVSAELQQFIYFQF